MGTQGGGAYGGGMGGGFYGGSSGYGGNTLAPSGGYGKGSPYGGGAMMRPQQLQTNQYGMGMPQQNAAIMSGGGGFGNGASFGPATSGLTPAAPPPNTASFAQGGSGFAGQPQMPTQQQTQFLQGLHGAAGMPTGAFAGPGGVMGMHPYLRQLYSQMFPQQQASILSGGAAPQQQASIMSGGGGAMPPQGTMWG